MKQKRKRAKTKITANGKILGRPAGRSKDLSLAPIFPKPVRIKRFIKRHREPGQIISPITGEIVELLGPPKPVYEWREVKPGRPPVKDGVALKHIIMAIHSKGKRGAAHIAAGQSPHRDVLSVKREHTRTRKELRRRADENS